MLVGSYRPNIDNHKLGAAVDARFLALKQDSIAGGWILGMQDAKCLPSTYKEKVYSSVCMSTLLTCM